MTGRSQNDVNLRLQFPSPGPLTPAAKSRTQTHLIKWQHAGQSGSTRVRHETANSADTCAEKRGALRSEQLLDPRLAAGL
ncbi:hypothetical protein QQF64_013996 [Cirrhinus molitorella]|uniref:Uncharacterized protein n=1 Tax=Cirrhinus molitorella TaxID=172907 RepID=A0ABR3LSS0_9TELE